MRSPSPSPSISAYCKRSKTGLGDWPSLQAYVPSAFCGLVHKQTLPLFILATTWSIWLSTKGRLENSWCLHSHTNTTLSMVQYYTTCAPTCNMCTATLAVVHTLAWIHKRSVYISCWMHSHSCSRSGKSLWPDVSAGSLEQQLYLTAKCTH